ncbi:ferredoxin [Clostridium sp. ZS2-4]|uniref:ferredoxin n=1 Tax=Clostridium sp. ZS2-4 TaxID=2987703 RepID=UPI00227CCEEA|nr:ferredoxin [Clostridium sp. ZS2-4]MCY6353803.1 ferredoxin [Clostridium sp. ZS2-4]
MLFKKGASIANIVIILSTWAVIKVPMLANEAKFLGVKFMGIRWIFTTISIFVMAYIVSKLVKKESIPFALEYSKKNITTAEVKREYCIGCRLCAKLSPKHFKIIDGKAVFNNENMEQKDFQHIKKIASKCPAKAIYFK